MAVADATGGEYYPAESADELHKVFENLPTNLITKHEVVEISVLFVALGAVLVALGDPARPGLAAVALTAPARGEDLACLVVDSHRSRSSC